ncbi:hypothetical protein AM1_5957 [Acaryochloris marina MBIC11017]|uniref:Uncharacterized protein n=1 Tax=Acaryochloris marina (strain MBIC 11017) TaxID=329726 RepID=B0C1Q9_ACAM1|nr:hypothetical protein AM1_5957 [Acaryochloris marina MBIC11017]
MHNDNISLDLIQRLPGLVEQAETSNPFKPAASMIHDCPLIAYPFFTLPKFFLGYPLCHSSPVKLVTSFDGLKKEQSHFHQLQQQFTLSYDAIWKDRLSCYDDVAFLQSPLTL